MTVPATAVHLHRFQFAPLVLNLPEVAFELVHDPPHPIELKHRRRDGLEEVIGYRPGLISHGVFRPTQPAALTFSVHADCADCGTQLDFGPFTFKELHGYLTDSDRILRETYPDEAE